MYVKCEQQRSEKHREKYKTVETKIIEDWSENNKNNNYNGVNNRQQYP